MIRAMAIVVAIVASASCAEDAGPRLDSVVPAAAPRGTHVLLAGERLCGSRADCEHAAGAVRIGASASVVQASVIAYGDTAAEIEIPDITPVGKTELIVTVNELASNALAFEVLEDGI